jgi:hypothetical protein
MVFSLDHVVRVHLNDDGTSATVFSTDCGETPLTGYDAKALVSAWQRFKSAQGAALLLDLDSEHFVTAAQAAYRRDSFLGSVVSDSFGGNDSE